MNELPYHTFAFIITFGSDNIIITKIVVNETSGIPTISEKGVGYDFTHLRVESAQEGFRIFSHFQNTGTLNEKYFVNGP